MSGVHQLVEPPEQTPLELAIEECHEIIAESIDELLAIDGEAGTRRKRRSYRSEDYDRGFEQGRKEAARQILIAAGEQAVGLTSDEVRGNR